MSSSPKAPSKAVGEAAAVVEVAVAVKEEALAAAAAVPSAAAEVAAADKAAASAAVAVAVTGVADEATAIAATGIAAAIGIVMAASASMSVRDMATMMITPIAIAARGCTAAPSGRVAAIGGGAIAIASTN